MDKIQPPLSLYIHIPWCVRKCPYCDFNSHQANDIPAKHYIECLLADLQHDLLSYAIDRPLHSIFIGGGTPSLFSATEIGQLLNGVNQQWPITSQIEVTMEANPGTVEHDNFADYRKAGVNRLSVGVQSFADDKLASLGRIHSGTEAIEAIKTIQDAGFDNINLDLMFGLPKQSLIEGLADLRQAIDLAPTHISFYQLTLEPNTVFYKKPPRLPDMDMIADLQDQAQQRLADAGYKQYEISAYSIANKQCQHNVNYWQFGDYLGIGAGAHGKITDRKGAVIRSRKVTMPNRYLQRNNDSYTAQHTVLDTEQLLFEYLLNRLRLNSPIPLNSIPAHVNLLPLEKNAAIQKSIEKKLLQIDDNQIYKTELGQRFLNDLLTLFL